ncbi:signal peptidase II [Candidatus Poribacteria bacterium]
MSVPINKAPLTTRIRPMRPMLIAALIGVFLDQLTKHIVRKAINTGNTIQVISGYFQFRYAENTGAAFGMFRGQNRIFIIISLAAICFMFVYYRQFKESTWMKISLGLLLGGALGNLVDRALFGYVTDFIRVRIWFLRWRWWPYFNVADALVCVGAVMLVLGMLKRTQETGGLEGQKARKPEGSEI